MSVSSRRRRRYVLRCGDEATVDFRVGNRMQATEANGVHAGRVLFFSFNGGANRGGMAYPYLMMTPGKMGK